MKIPLNWLNNYIKIEHTPEEIGDILTNLEFMQDGPIIDNVLDIEVRQNRPDMLSIIGTAREYSAYINKKVNYPEQLENIEVEWNEPKDNLKVLNKEKVRRFCTIEINNIKVTKSPEYIKSALKSYGIPSINNVVDITNFVMLEYGIPLHAFDYKKLKKANDNAILTIRNAKHDEVFETWQKTKLTLSSNDLVVADAEKPVAIAGIIGGANSDIDEKTTHIILEAAVYDHSTIRKTSLKHGLRTDASTRHEKILNPEMVDTAIRRALKLIQNDCNGNILKIEDFYSPKANITSIDFNIFEIQRLGGIYVDPEEAINLLERLGFKIIDHKNAIGIDKNIIIVHVPAWRTDVDIEASLVEEVLRLKGYDQIPFEQIPSIAPDYATPKDLQLEERIRDILMSLGANEHITIPIVKFSDLDNQIKLENPLNAEMNGLRTSIRETLSIAIERNQKAGNKNIKLFEVGKIFKQLKVGKYTEEKRIETLYSFKNLSNKEMFAKHVKPDFLSLLNSLGLDNANWIEKENHLKYYVEKNHIANLFPNGYEIIIQNLLNCVDVSNVPAVKIETTLSQKIIEEMSFIIDKNQSLGKISDVIKESSDNISSVEISDLYEDAKLGLEKASITLKVIFKDIDMNLTKKSIEEIKNKAIDVLSNMGIKLRN